MASSDRVAANVASPTVLDLPPEIIAHILDRLDHADYRACRAAARLWRVCSPSAYARRVLGAPYPPCPRDLGVAGDAMAIRGLLALGRLDPCSCAWMPFTAVWHGHMDMLVALHEAGAPGFDRDAMDYAAGFGRLDMVTFLHRNRREGCTSYALNRAAAQGHLPVVDFLHRHRREGCTRKAMDYAAANGHLKVVIYLDRNRTEGCTVGAINRAAAGGHRDVVAYLLAHRKEGASPAAMTAAAANGDVDMLRLLAQWNQPFDHRAMNAAATNGHLAALEYLDTALCADCTAEALVAAAAARHFDAVAFLLDRRLDDCFDGLSAASHAALAAGRVDMFQRMRGLMSPVESPTETLLRHTPPTVFRDIAAGGHVDAFDALCQHDPHGLAKNAPDMLAPAVAYGHYEIVNCLLSRGALGDSPDSVKVRHAIEDAVVDAAGRGHGDAIALVHREAVVSFTCLKKAAIAAAANGHVDALTVIESLCRSPVDHCEVAKAAARGGHLNVLVHIMPLDTEVVGYRSVRVVAGAAIRGAASGGHDDVIKWIVERHSDCLALCHSYALGEALAQGRVSTLCLLSDMARDGANNLQHDASATALYAPPQHAWNDAARAGHLGAITYMWRKGASPHDANAMVRAAIDGEHMGVIRFAYHALSSFDPQRALADARALSRHEIALWISNALSWAIPRPPAPVSLSTADLSWGRTYDNVVWVWMKVRPGKTAMMRGFMDTFGDQWPWVAAPGDAALPSSRPEGQDQRHDEHARPDGGNHNGHQDDQQHPSLLDQPD
ncbi:Ankyrin repeat domain containing protein [Pandoravirus neocaledonia]|uniref:Ankyrin repeat domain containing protein n=1 Tax=Pandoravirus neocaledonia TaxID=2107708 RepID=A0A2U7UBS4_9VIRU|nr:Ankyrin repeat domain containing protein [Pandoravirus neocaledonia]AVK75909.1 Ankyrin repeat domain containing protein [Pandoravirus neocaledonia]